MSEESEETMFEVESSLEEAKKPVRGRPRREITDEEAFRAVMLKEARQQSRALKAIRAIFGDLATMPPVIGGGRSFGNSCRFGRFFVPIQGLPGTDAIEAEVNRLLGEWTSEGWYPVHVASQPGILDFVEGGQMKGSDVIILWGHD